MLSLSKIFISPPCSGKTAGYLIPALAHIREVRRKAALATAVPGAQPTRPSLAPTVLVLAPTRELAQQIQEEAFKFGSPLGLRTT